MPLFDPDTIRPALAANFIGGQAVTGRGQSFMVLRPSDGGLLGELRAADAQQLANAVENAAVAQKSSGWGTMEPRGRMRLLRRLANLIEADSATPRPLEAVSSSRTLPEILAWDLPYTAECIRIFAGFADKHGGEIGATTPDKLGFTLTQPYGVVGAIAPWNLPLVMAAWKLGPALAGGKVSFTGSTRTGRAIMSASAQTGPRPSTLELGGKSPQLVFADADLAKAPAMVARAITLNAGQVCVAGSRLLVQDKVRDEVVERLTAAFEAHRLGATWDEGTTMGPIISEGQLAQIDGIVQHARTAGAEVVTGGARATAPQSGSYYQPTLLANVAAKSEAVQGEIFGPLLTVQSFADEEEAFALANGTRYGLAAGVQTNDLARAMRAIRTLDAGTV